MGIAVLKGLSLALEVLSSSPAFKLRVYNTASDPNYAAMQLKKMQKDGCSLGVALLGQKTAKGVVHMAQKIKMPLIVMTNERNLELGQVVYRDFVTDQIQLMNLASFALQDLGLHSFIILYPQNKYGQRYAHLFASAVVQNGGEIRKMFGYPPQKTDFGDIIKKIIGYRIAESSPEILITHPPTFPFDAIFIADTSLEATFIISQFAYYNARNLIFLGTALWNNPKFLSNIKQYCRAIYFPSPFNPKAQKPWVRAFVKRYQSAYKELPNYLAAQAYEIGTIIGYLESVAHLDIKGLPQYVQNFPGVTGTTTFLTNGDVDKKIWIVEVK